MIRPSACGLLVAMATISAGLSELASGPIGLRPVAAAMPATPVNQITPRTQQGIVCEEAPVVMVCFSTIPYGMSVVIALLTLIRLLATAAVAIAPRKNVAAPAQAVSMASSP